MSNTPLEQNGIDLDSVLEKVNALPQAGITPTGSITLTEEKSYDVTEKATAVVDMSATRANLAEAVTAKGVDTSPTASFDTIAVNIGLIDGGGGLPSANFTTAKSYSETSAFVNDIKAQTGFTKFLVIASDQITPSGYWLYWLFHSSSGNIVKRKTGGGDIGETTSATVVSISTGTKFAVYQVE